ncbi:MAG TPA: peptide chain release factor 2 [Gemmatales bacterium]|nr:peptide chain release factor 2 [Gemmatales bacterium]
MTPELSRRSDTLVARLAQLRDSLDVASKERLRAEAEAAMAAPGFWDLGDKAQATIQRLKALNNLLKPYEELVSGREDLEALGELCAEEASLEDEFASELARLEERLAAFELQAVLSEPGDSCSAYLRLQAGTGGTDACDFAQMLQRMYARWAEQHGFGVEIVDELPNEEAGIRSATLRIQGDYAFGRLQGETGVHRLVRISPFDANAKRQTSFVAVDVMPEIDDSIHVEIKRDDVDRQTFRSGGPGGQHQNKTESGVRLIHRPTGVVAECRSERSQHKNEDMCWKMLRAKLYRLEEQKRRAEIEKKYDEKGEVAWGNQIRNYVLQPYTLAKDVRTGVETAQVQKVLDGDLDEFIEGNLRLRVERAHKGK